MIDRRSYRLRLYRWLEQPPWPPGLPTRMIPTSPWPLTAEVISTRTLTGRGERMRASGPVERDVRRFRRDAGRSCHRPARRTNLRDAVVPAIWQLLSGQSLSGTGRL